MKLNANKWYKDPNLVAITTQNNKHLCNIYLINLLQICDEYDVQNGTIVTNDLLQLLDASCEIFETKETKMFQNVKQNLGEYYKNMFQNIYNTLFDTLSKTIPKEFLYTSEQNKNFDKKSRLEYNLKIIDKLKEFFEQNPHQRFFQGLFNLGIVEYSKPYSGQICDKFNEESKKTFNKLCDK